MSCTNRPSFLLRKNFLFITSFQFNSEHCVLRRASIKKHINQGFNGIFLFH